MKSLHKFYYFSLAMSLVACGGGGGNSGTSSVGGGGATVPKIASFSHVLDKYTITNSGADNATIIVTALDADNNTVAGVPLAVSLDSGIYTPISSITDEKGTASGLIGIGDNKSNRVIKYIIKMADQTVSGSMPVTGAALSLDVAPAAPMLGSALVVNTSVKDINGSGIAGMTVALSGSLLQGQTKTIATGATGIANFSGMTAPVIAGIYTLTSSAAGVTQSRQITVASTGGDAIPNAKGDISSASLAITPNTIAPNLTGGNDNQAVLRALFLDKNNRGIENMRVRFNLYSPRLDDAEKISDDNSIVYSDSSGIATSSYISGVRSSPTDGVKIRICYAMTDIELNGNNCPNLVIQTLTIAADPLSITIGNNNELKKGENNLTYIKLFDIAVADAAGNAVKNANLSASVDIVEYAEGPYAGPRRWCANEDENRNGSFDGGEDKNGNGRMDPPKADIIVSFVDGIRKTGVNGRATVQVEYSQRVATWLNYTLKVSTTALGSEGRAERSFITTAAEEDESNGSFRVPPYSATIICPLPPSP